MIRRAVDAPQPAPAEELWRDTAAWTVEREAQQDRRNDPPPPPDPPDPEEL